MVVDPAGLSPFSRDEVRTKWGVSDFIKAFIKFHGHVYLSKSLEKLSPLREKLEEQFKVRWVTHKFGIWGGHQKPRHLT